MTQKIILSLLTLLLAACIGLSILAILAALVLVCENGVDSSSFSPPIWHFIETGLCL